MSDTQRKTPGKASGTLAKVCFAIGGFSLIAAMSLDVLSVAGRRLGFPLTGSIELVQYCIAGIVSSAVVVATLTDRHAAVHVITERLGAAARAALARLSDGMSIAFLLALFVGDAWIVVDLWPRGERSDLLLLPFAPMRLLWCAALALAFLIVLATAFGLISRRKSDGA